MKFHLFYFTLFLLLGTHPLYCVIERDEGRPASGFSEDVGKDAQNYTEATEEASHYLNLIDQEQYGSAYSDAAPLFKAIISQEIWVTGLRAIRHPLGLVRARRIVSYDNFSTLPGGLKGNFFRLIYRTQYESGTSKQEVLILMDEGLNRWRLLSYSNL